MKNGILRSESDRAVSLILLVCMTIIAAGCVMGILYLQEYNFYKAGDHGETAKSIAVQIYSIDDVELAKDYYLCLKDKGYEDQNTYGSEYREDYYRGRFSTENTNFIFAI